MPSDQRAVPGIPSRHSTTVGSAGTCSTATGASDAGSSGSGCASSTWDSGSVDLEASAGEVLDGLVLGGASSAPVSLLLVLVGLGSGAGAVLQLPRAKEIAATARLNFFMLLAAFH